MPSAATLVREPDWGLDLIYGPETCHVRIRPKNDRALDYEIQATANSDLPVVAHVTLLPQRGQELTTGTAESRDR